jgi:hypothetical protein
VCRVFRVCRVSRAWGVRRNFGKERGGGGGEGVSPGDEGAGHGEQAPGEEHEDAVRLAPVVSLIDFGRRSREEVDRRQSSLRSITHDTRRMNGLGSCAKVRACGTASELCWQNPVQLRLARLAP